MSYGPQAHAPIRQQRDCSQFNHDDGDKEYGPRPYRVLFLSNQLARHEPHATAKSDMRGNDSQ